MTWSVKAHPQSRADAFTSSFTFVAYASSTSTSSRPLCLPPQYKMPELLLTTKRKFYSLLDKITNTSQTNTSTSTSTTKPRPFSTATAPDRPRLSQDIEARVAERAAKRLRPSISSASIASYRARLENPPPPLRPVSSYAPSRAASGTLSTASSSRKRRADGSFVGGTTSSLGSGENSKGNSSGKDSIPPFCPWSHPAFLTRLKSFAPVTSWLPKPDDAVGEVAWAKRGWSCVGTETVGCRACGKRIVVDFRPSEYDARGKKRGSKGDEVDGKYGSARIQTTGAGDDEDAGGHEADEADADGDDDDGEFEEAFEQGLVEKYGTLIIEGHGESCLWRQAGCKDDIYRLPVVRSAWWQTHVKDSYASVMAIAEEIKDVDIKPVEGAQPPVEKILRGLPPSFWAAPSNPAQDANATAASSEANDSSDVKKKALTIALTGWTATNESSTHLLSCTACFQRLGLWMYKKSDRQPNAASEDDNTTMDMSLDLIEQHREHCPLRNASSQATTGDYAGWPAWRILWDVAGRYADEQRRRSRDRYSIGGAVPTEGDEDGNEATATASEDLEAAKENLGGVEAGGAGEGEVELKDWQRREEVAKKDRERTNKLRRLKQALGFKIRVPGEKTAGETNAAAASG